jgi:hypothetical protein
MPAADSIFSIVVVARHDVLPSERPYSVNHGHDRSKKGFIPVASLAWRHLMRMRGLRSRILAGISSEEM